MTKRLFALFLCFALCMTILPAAFAEDIRIAGDGVLDVLPDEITVVPGDAETLASGSCGGAHWTLDGAGTLTISGGSMDNYSTSSHAPWWSCRDQIKKAVVEYSVYNIGDYAFYGCNNMTEAAVSRFVSSYGEGAFYECAGLKELTKPDGVPMGAVGDEVRSVPAEPQAGGVGQTVGTVCFYGCTALKFADISEYITGIGDYAFYGCTALEDFYMYPEQEITIGWDAFEGCTALTRVKLEASEIRGYAFYGCTALESVDLNGRLRVIGTSAFSNCTALEHVNMSDYVTQIDSFAFSGCSSLEEIVLGGALEKLGAYAFSDCGALHAVAITGFVPEFGNNCFDGVTAEVAHYRGLDWTSAAYKNYGGNMSWHDMPNYAGFSGWGEKGESDILWTATKDGVLTLTGSGAMSAFQPQYSHLRALIRRVEFSDGVTTVGNNAFFNMEEIAEISLPASLTSIGAYAFYNCRSLAAMTIPDGVTSIDNYAFAHCDALTELKLPRELTALGRAALGYCASLGTLRFTGHAPSFCEDSFQAIAATAWYPSGDPSWTASVRQNYGGTITWKSYTPGSGYAVTVTNKTGGSASTSLSAGTYSGTLSFTVSSTGDKAVTVIAHVGSSYSVLPCTDSGGKHNFSLSLTGDTEIILVYKGDADLNAKVNMRDALAIKKHVAGTELLTGAALCASDADGNGKTNMRDSLAIKKDVAGTEKIKW